FPVVRADVLDADDGRFGLPELPEERSAHERGAAVRHASVEVVRREEEQIPAVVPIPADDVVLVLGHVLLMPREDEQVVPLRELVATADAVEVVVGEEVDLLAGPVEPRDEVEVPVVEAERNAEVEKRTLEVDAGVPADVPRVAPAVAVRVL